jgi:hypothetical protein
VTLDLKGFEIRGTPGALGVFAVNRRRLTVRNGSVRGFATAVVISNTT